MAYFTSWSIYGRGYNVWDMDVSKLSHINYAFANIVNGVVTLGDTYADVEKVNTGMGDSWSDPSDALHGNFHQLFRLKQKNRQLKVGLSIGGWTWSSQFSVIARSERARKKFVASAVQFLVDYGFDYIDIDWEYPGGGGLEGNVVSANDVHNFVLLLEEFQGQILQNFPAEQSRPFLTIAAACSPKIYQTYQLAGMTKYLRYFNLMCYDFTGPWSPVSDHQANLFPRKSSAAPSEFSIDQAIRYFVSQGVAPGQLVLGVPIYGREFAACPGLLQPFHGTGKGSWEAGVYDYKALPPAGYQMSWERSTNSSFLFNQQTKSLITFDDPRAIAYKMDYVQRMKLGGVMFWEISADRPTRDTNSLLGVINAWIGGSALDKSANLQCYPKSKYSNIRNNPLCPSRKDVVVKPAAGMSMRKAKLHSDAMEYCHELFKREGRPIGNANRAHAVPAYVTQLQECSKQILAKNNIA